MLRPGSERPGLGVRADDRLKATVASLAADIRLLNEKKLLDIS